MKKINVAGISAVLGGTAMYGYVALGNFMGKSGNLKSYNKAKDVSDHKALYDILHEDNFDWIASLPGEALKDGANYIVTMPLWLLLIIVGAILLLIGGIFIKR
jgi:hypothetical protein